MIQAKKIEGLTGCYPEAVRGTSEWYYCKKSETSFCDLYEAEEMVAAGHEFSGMTCHLIHYPDGAVYTPFETQANVYVEAPVWCGDEFGLLRVDFSAQVIQVYHYRPEEGRLQVLAELPLTAVTDCYNLKLDVAPLMLTRSPHDETFEVIWPERKTIQIGKRETFDFRDGDDLYFSDWYEDPEYHEEVVVRDWTTGEEKARFGGCLYQLPDGSYWRL